MLARAQSTDIYIYAYEGGEIQREGNKTMTMGHWADDRNSNGNFNES